eukprot:11294035-Karenia_brevis.AAC.1
MESSFLKCTVIVVELIIDMCTWLDMFHEPLNAFQHAVLVRFQISFQRVRGFTQCVFGNAYRPGNTIREHAR